MTLLNKPQVIDVIIKVVVTDRFHCITFKSTIQNIENSNAGLGALYESILRCVPQNFDGKSHCSMSLCHPETRNNYLNRCWQSSLMPYSTLCLSELKYNSVSMGECLYQKDPRGCFNIKALFFKYVHRNTTWKLDQDYPMDPIGYSRSRFHVEFIYTCTYICTTYECTL